MVRYKYSLGLPGKTFAQRAFRRALRFIEFFNPIADGARTSAVNGAAEPFFNAAVANDPQVLAGRCRELVNVLTIPLLVIDTVLSGETPIELAVGPGGRCAIPAQP